MKINKEVRQAIWEGYDEIEVLVKNLKSIVQNEGDIDVSQIEEHKNRTEEVKSLLEQIHLVITSQLA